MNPEEKYEIVEKALEELLGFSLVKDCILVLKKSGVDRCDVVRIMSSQFSDMIGEIARDVWHE